jgi:hypothetical protein
MMEMDMYIDLDVLLDLDNNKELKDDFKKVYKEDESGDSFEEFVVELLKEELSNVIMCRRDSGGFLDY